MVTNLEEKMGLIEGIAKAFSPTAPIDQKALFAGRIQQTMDVINAVSQRGQHVVLFGERGVGKTSLANVLASIYRHEVNTVASRTINCDPTTTFSSLWHNIFREMPIQIASQSMGFTAGPSISDDTLNSYVPKTVTPDDVRHILQKIGKTIIVIDELDRIVDKTTTSLLADTIKNLSDHSVDTTLILVGVADAVDTLIAEHASIERALVQIRMPRMSVDELTEIIDKGLKTVQMTIAPDLKQRIARLSQGLPHYTHLLALHSAQHAAMETRTKVVSQDVRYAIEKAITNTQQSIIMAYHKATSSPRENLYPQVLLACALAKTDMLGYFSAPDVRTPMTRIMGKPYEIPAFSQHLNSFCDVSRGPILQKVGQKRRFKFRFVNPLMQPYVIMDGIKRGLISEDQAVI